MSIGILFWILYIVGLIFSGWRGFNSPDRTVIVDSLLWWILIFLLGWAVFEAPIK